MDRDIAMSINSSLNNLKTALQALVSNTSPVPSNNRRAMMTEAPDPAKDPDPVTTRTKK